MKMHFCISGNVDINAKVATIANIKDICKDSKDD